MDSAVEASCEGAFEGSAYVAVGLALGGALDLVGTGLRVAAQPGDGDGVQRAIEVAITAHG